MSKMVVLMLGKTNHFVLFLASYTSNWEFVSKEFKDYKNDGE